MTRKLFDKNQAKRFIEEAGSVFESKARQLVKDDYAELRAIKTAEDLYRAVDTLAAGLLSKEITLEEENQGGKILRAMVKVPWKQTMKQKGKRVFFCFRFLTSSDIWLKSRYASLTVDL